MEKLNYKKAFKDLYLPKGSPAIIEVPQMNFIAIDGHGDPNGEEFAIATTALYSLSYAVKIIMIRQPDFLTQEKPNLTSLKPYCALV